MEEKIRQKNPTLHRYLFTVTTFSKLLAMFFFILFPFVGFYLGMMYQEKISVPIFKIQNMNQIPSELQKENIRLSPPLVQTDNWQVKRVNINKDYTFNLSNPTDVYFLIALPIQYSIDTKTNLGIYDEQKRKVLEIYNYAAGEITPTGHKTIDGVSYILESNINNIDCLSELHPADWKPGTQSLLNIHVVCTKATQEELSNYTKIIEGIKFSPTLKKILVGN